MKLTIEKISKANKRFGDPDYILQLKEKGNTLTNWKLEVHWARIDMIASSGDMKRSIRDSVVVEKEHREPLYHLLGSDGNASIALVYKEYLHHWHPFYNLRDLDTFQTEIIISHLVHYTIWEPEKIIWKGYT